MKNWYCFSTFSWVLFYTCGVGGGVSCAVMLFMMVMMRVIVALMMRAGAALRRLCVGVVDCGLLKTHNFSSIISFVKIAMYYNLGYVNFYFSHSTS